MLTARNRALVVDTVERQLSHTPLVPTRNRKRLRPNPLAPWELRIGDLRALYDVAADDRVVFVLAIGQKRGNTVRIGGTVIDL